jgi:hypothetical protein
MRLPSRILNKLARMARAVNPQQPWKRRVLVLGIYLADRKNTVEHLVAEFASSKDFDVEQRWAALNGESPSAKVDHVTTLKITGRIPKFTLINRLISEISLSDYDFLIVSDDDITLPRGFLDSFLDRQCLYDFALAQPARTHNSYLDHSIVEVVDGLEARETCFVEIGPLFCMSKGVFSTLLPFDEKAPMGWGLDFVWPAILQPAGFKMGIVDAVTVDHSHRKPFTQYDGGAALQGMHSYLATCPHLEQSEAFVVLHEYRSGHD